MDEGGKKKSLFRLLTFQEPFEGLKGKFISAPDPRDPLDVYRFPLQQASLGSVGWVVNENF